MDHDAYHLSGGSKCSSCIEQVFADTEHQSLMNDLPVNLIHVSSLSLTNAAGTKQSKSLYSVLSSEVTSRLLCLPEELLNSMMSASHPAFYCSECGSGTLCPKDID